ncbi:hypothetical protein J25TS5_39150 [Paenibacillus faecis]|uniref:hypothetical protein n=1 Tax=Paenibacillus faecis TaxID=862114 RepID=UPI001B1CD949|nr:hypothetical protein [Paenibacillus faecis]GIO86983.1 hypothetical protein J25TS5_39150 [Paenibacillus faecis]
MSGYRLGGRRGGRGKRLVRQTPTAYLLQRMAAGMLPLYKTVACNPRFAEAWSRAVVGADLDGMKKMLCVAAPRLAHHGLGSNGIGYFISFSGPSSSSYSCGVTIPPGQVQFHFNPRIHQRIARAVLPYYREMARRPSYCAALARAIRRGHHRAASRLVRCFVKTAALKAVKIQSGGIKLVFKYPSSKYEYTCLLFREF